MPIWRKPATTRPEQSNVAGPALKNWYGVPTCALRYVNSVSSDPVAELAADVGATAAGAAGVAAIAGVAALRGVGIGIVAGGSVNVWPGMITLATVMELALTSAPSFTPWRQAIPASASPAATV